ncbi:hypothetical protein CAOG_008347 [Capsaspora owczarzaki ATCC 30864]|uniref:Uncharacterized protein n=1 Tax=Capsaspora owczarzaki (strain ATCC 30864) TaxID=595528 RepID=A0A0D2W227_CAPO3|nr:hypothetical protein CAOG_008347 [Capsaspora owczarzaki ATCC 30864]
MTPNEDSDNDEYDYLLDDADRDEYSSPRDVSQVRIRGPRRVTCLRGETRPKCPTRLHANDSTIYGIMSLVNFRF